MTKRIFVAGGTGLAGSSIIRHLLVHNPDITVRASFHSTRPFFHHERLEYVQGDLAVRNDCVRMVRDCDCAVMAAAFTGGAAFLSSSRWEHMRANLLMNTQMLDAVRAEKIERFIFIGSATLYQDFSGHIREDDLDMNKDPHGSYFGFGWAVRYLEKMCRFLHEESGIRTMIARVSNIYGPHSKFDPATSNFIPALIRKAVNKMDPFEIWGSPDVTRDVIYSEDFAAAIEKMIFNEAIEFDVFNIGSGVTTTVQRVVELALRYAGHTPSSVLYAMDGPRTTPFRALDCSRARDMLGWSPCFTIEEGMQKTVQWWIENKSWWKK